MLLVRRDSDEREATVALLRQLGARRPRKPKPVPWRGIPLSMEVEYQRELAAIVGHMAPAFEQLVNELPRLLVEARTSRGDALRTDAGEGKRARALVSAAYRAMTTLIRVEDVEHVAMKHARRAAELNGRMLSRAAKVALGVELAVTTPHLGAILEQHVAEVVAHVLAIPDLVTIELEKMLSRAITTGRIDGWRSDDLTHPPPILPGNALENAKLIKGVDPVTAQRIAETVARAKESGDLAKTLAKELEARFAFAKRRAELIARDQIGKLTGQVNAARQKAMGLTRFTWRSVHDQRVRPEHRNRDGQIYAYASPPAGELPGEPVNCRCYAEPRFEDLLEEPQQPAPIIPPIAPTPPPTPPKPAKNPKRVAAAKKAAAASAERRREIHGAVKSNLPQELHVVWDKEGHKFMQEEAARIRGVKDRVNASSTLSQAFAEKYGSGAETAFGNEGDRFYKRAEIEAAHAETWAAEQERKHYEAMERDARRSGEIDDDGELTSHGRSQIRPAPTPAKPWEIDDDDPPF